MSEGDGNDLVELFTQDGEAYLSDGRTILRGDELRLLSISIGYPEGLERSILRFAFISEDVALVQQRAAVPNAEKHHAQESILLMERDGAWRIQQYQTTPYASWAAEGVAQVDSAPPADKRPEVTGPEVEGRLLADVSPDEQTEVRSAVEALLKRHEESYRKRSAELYADCFQPNAVLMPMGGQAIVLGQKMIHRAIEPALASPWGALHRTQRLEELKVLGPRLAIARLSGTVFAPDGSNPFEDTRGPGPGLLFRIALRGDDGQWRYQLQHNTPSALIEE